MTSLALVRIALGFRVLGPLGSGVHRIQQLGFELLCFPSATERPLLRYNTSQQNARPAGCWRTSKTTDSAAAAVWRTASVFVLLQICTVRCRVLATLEDHTNLLLQQGLLVWARPEALAGVIATRFVELPSNAAGGVAATQATLSLRERLDFQILSLKVPLCGAQ